MKAHEPAGGTRAESVQAAAPIDVAGRALELPFYRGGLLALAFLGGFFVELAATNFGEYTRFFASPLESSQGGVKMLVFFYANARQCCLP